MQAMRAMCCCTEPQKFYFEVRVDYQFPEDTNPLIQHVYVFLAALKNKIAAQEYSYGLLDAQFGIAPPFFDGYRIAFAINASTRKMWVAVNGAWEGSGDPEAGTNEYATVDAGITLFPFVGDGNANLIITGAFSPGDWFYAPPAGYVTLGAGVTWDPAANTNFILSGGNLIATGAGDGNTVYATTGIVIP